MPRFETQTWNHRLQATGISRGSAFSLTYAYCASGASCATNNGNVVSQTIGHAAGAVQNYTFDTLGRLAAASESSAWSRSFDADQWRMARKLERPQVLDKASFASRFEAR